MIKQEIKEIIRKAVEMADFAVKEIEISKPENETFGDYSTNVAMKLARASKKSPIEIAQDIKNQISKIKSNIVEKIEIVKPGFINFYLTKEYLQNQPKEILKKGKEFGQIDIGKNQKIQVEFISANPTGPLTLGNGRGGFFGDVLANVLKKAGYEVTKEYFINDIGEQIKKLGHSAKKDEQAVYKGAYIETPEIVKIANENISVLDIGSAVADIIMGKFIRPVISTKMEIKIDRWQSEKELHERGLVEKVFNILKEKNLTYEKEGALWFKSSEFGDDKDRVLVKADGEKTYFLSDIAYHLDKFINRKFDKVIDVWGADHHGYIGRLQAAKKALEMPGDLKIIIIQLVKLFSGGQEIRMSKRLGTYVTIDELIDEVGLDAARFFFLMRSPDSHLNFDMDLAKEQSQKNPVYYVQYAYARIHSILEKSKVKSQKSKVQIKSQNFGLLENPNELDLIKQLVRLPEVVEDTAKDHQVQRLPNYALDLVASFHKFYETCRVISDDEKLTQARLSLVEATRIILKNVLDLMGIFAPEKM